MMPWASLCRGVWWQMEKKPTLNLRSSHFKRKQNTKSEALKQRRHQRESFPPWGAPLAPCPSHDCQTTPGTHQQGGFVMQALADAAYAPSHLLARTQRTAPSH